MRRVENWEGRLHAIVEKYRVETLSWGSFDCVLFAMNAIDAIVKDSDMASAWRGKYSSKDGADDILKKWGGSVLACVTDHLGKEQEVAFTKRGDIVGSSRFTIDDHDMACGVCIGMFGAFITIKGVQLLGIDELDHSWPIGWD